MYKNYTELKFMLIKKGLVVLETLNMAYIGLKEYIFFHGENCTV